MYNGAFLKPLSIFQHCGSKMKGFISSFIILYHNIKKRTESISVLAKIANVTNDILK